MELGVHDIAIDLLKERLEGAKELMRERYKGVRSFREEPMSEKELLYNYMKMTPEEHQQFNIEYPQYARQMEQIRGKYNA